MEYDHNNLNVLHLLNLKNIDSRDKLSEVNSIITIKSFIERKKETKIYNILIGMYSTTIIILNYDYKLNKLYSIFQIENACNLKKPGISTIDFIEFEIKKKDELEDMGLDLFEGDLLKNENDEIIYNEIKKEKKEKIQKIQLISTGGYDCNLRFYEFIEEELNFNFIGALFNGSSNIIHKIKFVENKNNENKIYLFVASDQKILNIYNIA